MPAEIKIKTKVPSRSFTLLMCKEFSHFSFRSMTVFGLKKNVRFGCVDHLSGNSRIPIKFFHQDVYNCRSISGYFDATEGLGQFTIKNNTRNIFAEDEKVRG